MAEETSREPRDAYRLTQEEQSEIGDILVSARAVARQMISQAREQADAILKNAQDKADETVRSAEEAKAAVLKEAEDSAAALRQEAEEAKAAVLKEAEESAAALRQEAEEAKAAVLKEAEDSAAALRQEAENFTAPEEAERSAPPEIPEDMQEYVVRYVGDCFARLHRQQLETAELLNEQWRNFLCGLTLADEPKAIPQPKQDEEISLQEIESRVSAIAQELMDIIGK